MDEQSERTALLSALNTEHFVLQSANSTTYSEASSRSTLYVMADRRYTEVWPRAQNPGSPIVQQRHAMFQFLASTNQLELVVSVDTAGKERATARLRKISFAGGLL